MFRKLMTSLILVSVLATALVPQAYAQQPPSPKSQKEDKEKGKNPFSKFGGLVKKGGEKLLEKARGGKDSTREWTAE